MHRPRSIGCEYNASDFNMALVMSEIVTKPGEWTQLSVGQKINASQPTVSRSVNNLEAREWVARGQKVPRVGSGRTPNLLLPTQQFTDASARAAVAAEALDFPLNELYRNTVDAVRISNSDTESLVKLESRARFLGGVAVLGEQADLQEMTAGEWLSEQAGWHLLVVTQSVRTNQNEA